MAVQNLTNLTWVNVGRLETWLGYLFIVNGAMHKVVIMSRGLGVKQRAIMEALESKDYVIPYQMVYVNERDYYELDSRERDDVISKKYASEAEGFRRACRTLEQRGLIEKVKVETPYKFTGRGCAQSHITGYKRC